MTTKKNILLITSDQHHWTALGCLSPEVKTPNLDRLAAQGMLFDRAYCPNPTCTPTRSSLITGQYPSQHGAWSLGTKLPDDAHTVGDDFQAAGYRTALIGKAHFQQLTSTEEYPSVESYPLMQDLDYWRNFTDPWYGFEHVETARMHADEGHAGQHYAIWMEEKGFTNWRECFQPPGGTNKAQEYRWNIPEEYHYNTWIAERTNACLDGYKKNDENFFLWASFFDPHPPYLVPEPWDTMYDPAEITLPEMTPGEHDDSPPLVRLAAAEKNPDFSPWQETEFGSHGLSEQFGHDQEKLRKDIAVYYGMVSCMDKYIGVILDQLDTLGLTDNTLVVFTSDHGHYYGHHGLIAKGPFHYDDGIRVPMIARLPGVIPEGSRNTALQSLVDYPQTFLKFAGIDAPNSMTGVDQSAVWAGKETQARDHLLVEFHHQPTTIHLRTLVEERYKLTVYYNETYGELYDLQDDPGEIKNLWALPEYAELKSKLLLKLIHGELGREPMWMPRVAGA